MDFESLKKILEEASAARGITEYEIYYMSNDELSVDTLNKEPNSFSAGVRGSAAKRSLQRTIGGIYVFLEK